MRAYRDRIYSTKDFKDICNTKEDAAMMNLIKASSAANMSVFLSEDVCLPELRNPILSGMRKTEKRLLGFLLRDPIVKK